MDKKKISEKKFPKTRTVSFIKSEAEGIAQSIDDGTAEAFVPPESQKETIKRNYSINYNSKHFADLTIRLEYDGLKKYEFFEGVMEGYLNKDPDFMRYLDKWKQALRDKIIGEGIITPNPQYSRISKLKQINIEKERKKEEKIIRYFGLEDEEIEDIFDLLEEDILRTNI